MLNQISIKNFKSINTIEPIELKAFTIICGSNSSGKSSLLQAILMLSQSYSSRYQDEPITLNGPFIRLGSFQDIKKHNTVEDEIHLSISLPIKERFLLRSRRDEILYLTNNLIIGLDPKKESKDDEFHPRILESKAIISSIDDDGSLQEIDRIEIAINNELSKSEAPYLIKSFNTKEDGAINSEFPDFKILGSDKGSLIPSILKIEYDLIKKISGSVIDSITSIIVRRGYQSEIDFVDEEYKLLPKKFIETILDFIRKEKRAIYDSISIPEDFFSKLPAGAKKDSVVKTLKNKIVKSTYNLNESTIPKDFLVNKFTSLNDWKVYLMGLDDKPQKSLIGIIDKNRKVLQSIWCQEMPPKKDITFFNSRIFNDVERFLSFYFTRSVKYLGPLRIEPQAIYSSLGHYDPNTVGLKGEFTAAVLHKNKEVYIDYLSPILIDDKFSLDKKKKPLKIACQEWLSYLGVVQEFTTADKGKLGYELNVKINKNEKWQDLTHVGVGVSQVLPIVLMFLLSEEDDILIFEQPELHLHPKVQSRLCDLFIAMKASKRQCIIETHSEYLINRLRLRIAQEKDTEIQDNTSLYFVSKNEGTSEFINVEINKYGTIKNWPVDFFDQTDREIERILYEASLKRKIEKNKE